MHVLIPAEQESLPLLPAHQETEERRKSISLALTLRVSPTFRAIPRPTTQKSPFSFYNTLFWYGGASSDDTDELPAMNFQDLLERYDLPAIEQSSARPRVRGGPDHRKGTGLRQKARLVLTGDT